MSLSYSDVHVMLYTGVNIQELQIPPQFNKYLVNNKYISSFFQIYFTIISIIVKLFQCTLTRAADHSPPSSAEVLKG